MISNEIGRKMVQLRASSDFSEMESFICANSEFLTAANGGPFHLDTAAGTGDLEYVQWLVRHGVGIDSASIGSKTPPIFSAFANDRYDVVRWLVQNGANVNFTIDDKPPFCAMLMMAIQAKNDELARLFIDAGALLNVHDRYMMTPLSWAIRCGRTELADYIRARGGKMPNEIPGWVEPKTKGPLVQRVEQIIGPCHPNSWQAILPRRQERDARTVSPEFATIRQTGLHHAKIPTVRIRQQVRSEFRSAHVVVEPPPTCIVKEPLSS